MADCRSKAVLMALLVELSDSKSDSDSSSEEIFARVASVASRVQGPDNLGGSISREMLHAPKDFLQHFQVNRALVASLESRYRSECGLEQAEFQELGLSSEQHLLIFLYYVGHRVAENEVCALFGIHFKTFVKVIDAVVRFLCSLMDEVIKWPTPEQQRDVRDGFRQKGFQGVLGCLDVVHIAIDAPAARPEMYVNLEGYHSIRLQGFCDHTHRFTDVFIGQPGSVRPALALKASPIYPRLPELCRDGYVLASNAFPPSTFILTPYRDDDRLAEWQRQYNDKHRRTLATVRRTHHMLQQRFPRLCHIKCNDVVRCKGIIQACCILHNLADQEDLMELECGAGDEDEIRTEETEEVVEDTAAGQAFRKGIAMQVYQAF